MELLWRSGARSHDWTDREQPRHLIETAAAVGILSSADWIDLGLYRRRTQVHTSVADLPSQLFDLLEKDSGALISAGGSEPGAWELFLALHPWDARSDRVDGINMATFRFDGSPFAGRQGSDLLFGAFGRAHSPDTTEFAFIHPAVQASELLDEYKPPLVSASTIAGAYWAMFLGPGHLEEFDLQRLRQIRALHSRWIDDRGLFLRTVPTVVSSLETAGRDELLALTGELRAAQHPE